MNLNQEVLLLKCQQVNENWKSIVRNPLFLYEKCDQMGILEKNDEKILTKKIIQAFFNDNVTKEDATITLLNIISEQSLYTFLYEFYTINKTDGDEFGVYSSKDGQTPIYWAARMGHTEIVKILTPLTDNPNAANNIGCTPIHVAACDGHTEIVKILAPLTDNPNDPNYYGETPVQVAKNEEIRGILETFKTSKKRNAKKSKKF